MSVDRTSTARMLAKFEPEPVPITVTEYDRARITDHWQAVRQYLETGATSSLFLYHRHWVQAAEGRYHFETRRAAIERLARLGLDFPEDGGHG